MPLTLKLPTHLDFPTISNNSFQLKPNIYCKHFYLSSITYAFKATTSTPSLRTIDSAAIFAQLN